MNYKRYMNIIIIIFLAKFIFACSYFKSPGISFNINAPSLTGSSRSLYSSFTTVQIPISITNSSGFQLQKALTAGSNSVQIPSGSIHIKIGYLAFGNISGSSGSCNNNNNGGGPNNVLYSEYEFDYTIDSNTSSININFPSPFSLIPVDHFGFLIKDKNGNPATNATIYYFDLISEQNIVDPCEGKIASDVTDSQGRVAVELPIYSNSLKFRFMVQTADGNTKVFKPVLTRGATKAQFYYVNMADGSVTAMNENTDSFLQDGYSIAYTRDVLQKNPRFPDFYTYTLQSVDANNNIYLGPQSNSQDPYSLINRRGFDIYCQIKDYSNTNILYPFQLCPRQFFTITTLPITWTYGQTYNIYAFIKDRDGYIITPSNSYIPFNYYLP
ncbi:hypothetical protein QEJ31_15635 [Pigmentibacter sp. JX0631]|uniref:hypothetical protein n=1 Tax=Pigmentibacter sp. JX0631 TaxID=2976982 RepID=UPI002469649B|nr:hypothetical protein [Pigmentibacter sp. JX0631]WGL59964.1 hypothetical protein QEJ31_15635 [Pigmentibacter sp. JX0631]